MFIIWLDGLFVCSFVRSWLYYGLVLFYIDYKWYWKLAMFCDLTVFSRSLWCFNELRTFPRFCHRPINFMVRFDFFLLFPHRKLFLSYTCLKGFISVLVGTEVFGNFIPWFSNDICQLLSWNVMHAHTNFFRTWLIDWLIDWLRIDTTRCKSRKSLVIKLFLSIFIDF